MIKSIIFDLDGTVYMGSKSVPGAPEAIQRYRDAGIRILFLTNRANRTPERIAAQLAGYGIDAEPDEILTSAQAAAEFITPRTSAFFIGEEGLERALADAGFRLTDASPDNVVVGLDRGVTYDKLETACLAIRAGAQFFATNTDNFLYTDKGLSPGAGAIVEAVRVATGIDPVVIGKPEHPIIDIALRRLNLDRTEIIMVGDNPETDVLAGYNAGIRTVLILAADPGAVDPDIQPRPDWTITGYDELDPIVFSAEG